MAPEPERKPKIKDEEGLPPDDQVEEIGRAVDTANQYDDVPYLSLIDMRRRLEQQGKRS